MVGIIQEQHPDRARLFMQWKQMGWPILVDSLNLLEVSVVPMTLLIDEYGIIREVGATLAEAATVKRTFLDRTYEPPVATQEVPAPRPPDLQRLREKAAAGTATALASYADALAVWGGVQHLDEALATYDRSMRADPENGFTHFRLGVAYRRRYDSDHRQPGDFQSAVQHWERALEIDPNQYIWRRRIQQYGPRLAKPYPFYDWVETARREISARGDVPVPLPVEPGGAEIASPLRSFASASGGEEPDPGGRIYRDEGQLVQVETAVVPEHIEPGGSTRIHLIFRPNAANEAHWNNEVGELVVWLEPPAGWEVDRSYLTVANPPTAVSQEAREVEFEVMSPPKPSAATLPGYALYYVCEDVHGACLYRRQDLQVALATGASDHR
ncbi:MAG: hypothetical protein ACE5HV_10290 [Acidobacteriota bacterium]